MFLKFLFVNVPKFSPSLMISVDPPSRSMKFSTKLLALRLMYVILTYPRCPSVVPPPTVNSLVSGDFRLSSKKMLRTGKSPTTVK